MSLTFDMNRGPSFNPAAAAQSELRGDRSNYAKLNTWDYAVVTHFDHAKQTVSVRLLCDPQSQPFTNVSIEGSGGRFQRIWNLRGTDLYPDDPDVGKLLFPRLDMRLHNLGNAAIQSPATKFTHLPFNPTFLPGTRYGTEPKAVAVRDGLFPVGTEGYTDRLSGASDIYYEDGTVEHYAERHYLLQYGQTRANAARVARLGDSVSGSAITGGSTNVYAG